jgi:type II secretory pathway predicted ATPase ExeA
MNSTPQEPPVIANLQAHYGFSRMPFGRDLAPGMLHRHHAHDEAVARINWCVTERSIGVITGEVGAGKTVAVRTVMANLDASRHTTIYLPNPMIGARGIHEAIVTATGANPTNLSSRLISQARAALAAERDERGRTPILILDEAHLLSYEQLETTRMLSNQSMDQDSPLAILLVGQPSLRRQTRLAVLAALEQRIGIRYSMPPMTNDETTSYIRHHHTIAGRSDTLFSDDAINLIHATARGYPRAVNNLALQALVATYAARKAIVDESAARAAIAETDDHQ